MRYRSNLAMLPALAICLAASSADADLVFENPWDGSATDAGAFSQPSQILSGQFSLGASTSLVRATWMGTMFSPDPLDTGDTWNFDVVFWNDSGGSGPGSMISTEAVVAFVTDTGVDISGERVYEFDASFSGVPLNAATTYHMSVINTSTVNTFRWNIGTDGSNPSWFSSDSGNSWTLVGGNRAQVNMRLYNIPEPTTASVLGAAALGFVMLRRKRR